MKYNPYLEAKNDYPLAVLQQEAQKLIKQGRHIINLTIGDPKEKIFEPLKKALTSEIDAMSYSQYPVHSGSKDYLDAVSIWAKNTYDVTLKPETDILSCNGSKEAIFLLPIAFDWTDKEIFIPSLSYPVYAASAGLMNIKTRHLPVTKHTNFLPDLDKIDKEIWQKCQLFWLNSPHNPTTTIASKAYLEKLLALAEKYDFLVCSDECYNDLYYAEKPASCLEFPDSKHWIVFRSLSKRSHMTGFRIGAMISKNTALITHLKRMRASMGVGTPTFIQKAAISAWNDMQHPQQHADLYKEKRNKLIPALKKLGFEIFGGDAGFYLWFSHPNYPSSQSICESFLKRDILITPGTAFGSDGEGFARMVYCETDEIIDEVIKRLES